MHKEYTKVVKEKFGTALAEALPQFHLSRLQGKVRGGRLYQYVPDDSLILFVALIVHDNADEFNVDIGFTRDGLCPEESFFLSPNDTLCMPSVLFRLSEFRDDEKDPWWVIEDYLPIDQGKARFDQTGTTAPTPDQYLPRIDALIADAVKKLQQYAVPYIDAQGKQTKQKPCPEGHGY